MTIVRAPRMQRDFTILSNSVCLDSRLSMRALGLLVRLLCRPDDWRTNSETLAREFGCGREQMRGVLRELEEAGYMQLRKDRKADGTFLSCWYVFDEPRSDSPGDGEPGPGKPYSGRLGPIPRTDLPRTDTNPLTPKGGLALAADAQTKTKAKAVTIKTWLADVATTGEEAIPADDTIFSYAAEIGLPSWMLSLAWCEFRARMGAKRQSNWRQTFRNYIRGGYLKLWFQDAGGTWQLTTAGKQAQAAHKEAA